MQVKKVLNIEDDVFKHIAIKRALDFCGLRNVDHADDAENGIAMLEEAIAAGAAYDLLVLDMQFPVNGKYHEEAGSVVMDILKEKGIEIPIIICSSLRLRIPGTVACLFYNESTDLNMDMREALATMGC